MKVIIFSMSWICAILFSFQYNTTVSICPDDNTFMGTTNTDWSNSSNWSAGCVPGDDGGIITGAITISSDCTVNSSDASDYTFGTGSSFILGEGVTFTNNGTGTWTIEEIKGIGTYEGSLALTGTIRPGLDALTCNDGSLHPAFSEFNSASVIVSLNGDDVTIETDALPDHTSPYWDTSNPLYIDPVVADPNQMSPGIINPGSYTLTIPASPVIAANTSETGLGAIGIAVTGVPIFNGQEGPNINLSANVASGFDYAGGHNGPTGYHYHLESADVTANTTLSFDDDQLVGILQDGFFLYGRKCNSTGDHPTDLDESGGHTSSTQHCGDEYYHYHIINEFFVDAYILLFGAALQGTPNGIM